MKLFDVICQNISHQTLIFSDEDTYLQEHLLQKQVIINFLYHLYSILFIVF